jgi:hypothetical protein
MVSQTTIVSKVNAAMWFEVTVSQQCPRFLWLSCIKLRIFIDPVIKLVDQVVL